MLSSPKQRACRLDGLSWSTDDHLIVTDWISGAVWLWDVPQRRVQQIAVGVTSGVNLHLAGDVVADRFSG
jgi:hypothetical protein